jgi:ATP-dependent Lon protease
MTSEGQWGDKHIPQKLTAPLLPLRDLVVFPNQVSTLFIGRARSLYAVDEAAGGRKLVLLSAQKKAQLDHPTEDDVFRVGTLCGILQVMRYPNETAKIQYQGLARAKIIRFQKARQFFSVDMEIIREPKVDVLKEEALMRSLMSYFDHYVKVNKKISPDLLDDFLKIRRLGVLADAVAASMTSSKIVDKQMLLEEKDPVLRAERLIELMMAEIEIMNVQRRIQTRIKRQMDRDQKEYYLSLQKQAISKELGEGDEFQTEFKELEDRIKEKKLSQEAKVKAERELKKLKMMSPMSSEAAVIRNYLDWLVAIPWGEIADENIDIQRAARILDEDHYGLEKVKERILEYIAVGRLVGKVKGPILCLVGPPGVGKTSLGSSIARACGRKFVRVSLGGVRDEAEIRGHRRTYIGAYPGKIIYGMKRAGASNPVFLLDEVDKMTVDYRGDPAAALLEVLDPEQNGTFVDHFLDVEYDLSNVMFVTTANTVEGIPLPLLDRMEVLELPGYTEIEKFHIARKFLIPKQLKACGIESLAVTITDAAMRKLIRRYTREAGVRNLERELSSLCRKLARKVLERPAMKNEPIRVTGGRLTGYLGVPRYRVGFREKSDEIGLCNGLAYTSYGGDILQVEVSIVRGKGNLLLTGKLGEVMRESGQAAVSYLRKKASILNVDPEFYQKNDIHIHLPEGAVPKDGPSAGITIATALVSAVLGVPARKSVALTGEITLRGKVLQVGGIKEKLIAAARGRVSTVIMPRGNRKNLKELPGSVLSKLRIILVDHMDEVLRDALSMDEIEKIFPVRGTVLEPPPPPRRSVKDEEDDDLPIVEISDEIEEIRLRGR